MSLRKNIVRCLIIGLAIIGLAVNSAYAKGTIICGKSLCTVGDGPTPNYQRKCLEIKNINRNKCDYKCMGYKEQRPSKCSQSGYECVSYAKSRNKCADENEGRSIDPNNKPSKYRNYTEAKYTDYENNQMGPCTDGVAVALCKCGDKVYGVQTVCKVGEICTKTEQGYHRCEKADASIAGGNSTTTTDNNAQASDGLDVQSQIDATNADSSGCITVAQYQSRWTSGCWSCLVVGKLTEAFMSAASAGLGITKDAGKKLLLLGFMLWLAFWALKNVSSFTEIKGGNVLNDLLRTGAKVVLAWICIETGLPVIQNFVIKPIMGVGATIAQNFIYEGSMNGTGKTLRDYGWEDFDWDVDPFVDHSEEFEENEVPATSTEIVSEDEESQEIGEMDEQLGAELEIPPFQVPGTNGSLTSFPGCRIPPPTPTGCGSYAHMGLDVGSSYRSGVWAMAGGTVTYSTMSGYGNVVKIVTEHKGNRWEHLYAHMNYYDWSRYAAKNSGRKVSRGDIIGGVGCTKTGGPNETQQGPGCAYAQHLHVEVLFTGTIEGKRYSNAILDPMSLADGKIVVRGHKTNGITSATLTTDCDCRKKGGCKKHSGWVNHHPTFEEIHPNKKWCMGFNLQDPDTSVKRGQRFPQGGVTSPGAARVESSGVMSGEGGAGSEMENIVQIGDVKYHGKTDIMPKSIMNSMLAATKAITDTTAQMMVLGNMAMCYSHMAGGGAWTILKFGKTYISIINIPMWLDGAILWFLGFVLTCIVAYYLIDISFKLGLAVLALPLIMGLWPFKVTQGKLAETIAIIAKSAAIFAFLALTTYYTIELIVASFGGDDMAGVYKDYDDIILGTIVGDERDAVAERLDDYFQLFSAGFIMVLFACIYGYKLIRKTTDDLAEKFYSDGAFKGQNPMHKGLTGVASMAASVNKKWGTGLLKDMAAHKVGKGIKKVAGKGARAGAAGLRSIKGGARSLINKVRGKP